MIKFPHLLLLDCCSSNESAQQPARTCIYTNLLPFVTLAEDIHLCITVHHHPCEAVKQMCTAAVACASLAAARSTCGFGETLCQTCSSWQTCFSCYCQPITQTGQQMHSLPANPQWLRLNSFSPAHRNRLQAWVRRSGGHHSVLVQTSAGIPCLPSTCNSWTAFQSATAHLSSPCPAAEEMQLHCRQVCP